VKGQSLEKIQQEADESIRTSIDTNLAAEEAEDLIFRLGEISAAHVISRNLESAVIVGLQVIRDERKYTALGFERFDDFLDNWHRAPMKYKRFNYLEGLHEELGSAGFDLMRGSGISYRQMKMLEAGDIVVEGQEVIIGGEDRVSLGDSRVVKDLVEKLIQERSAEKAEKEKLTRKVEKQQDQLNTGRQEYEELRRNFDALDETPRFQRAVMQLMNGFFNLQEAIGELDGAEKQSRASEDLKLIAGLYFQLEDAYGLKAGLARPLSFPIATMKPLEEMTEEEKKATFFDRHPELSAGDDLSDEEEDGNDGR
jgi:hypothetical protein